MTGIGAPFLIFLVGLASAQEPSGQELEKVLKDRLGLSNIQSVQPSPVDGLYEVVVRNQVLYATPNGRYLIRGQILDTVNRANLTAQRKRELQTSQVVWSDLPLDHSITWGDPKGRKVAVFSDPMCPHCKRVHHQLQKMDNVRVHELMMPLETLHEGATQKAQQILCTKDPAQALHHNFAGKAVSGSANCEAAESVTATLEYAQSKGWNGTPVLVRSDGTVLLGAPKSRKALRDWLNQAGS